MIHFTTVHIKLIDGPFMTIRSTRIGKVLYMVDHQNSQDNANKVHVRTQENKCLFVFTYKNEKCYYVLCLVEGNLELERKEDLPVHLPECYWFKKVNQGAGEYYSLMSVSEPGKYLAVSADEGQIFTSTDAQKSLMVTDVSC